MDVKRIWFVSNYSMPPQYEMRVKTLRYMEYFQKLGIECTIFTASTIHNTDINLIRDGSLYIERHYGSLHYVHIKCSDYHDNGIRRIINMEQFAYRFPLAAKHLALPDVVVTDVYCPIYKPVFRFCKAHKVPIVLDVRDLWPQSIVEYLHFSENNPIIRTLYRMEKNMYMQSDRIVFSADGEYDYLIDRGIDKFIPREKVSYINNGVDVEEFERNVQDYQIDDPDLMNEQLFKVVYVGSIRTVNNLGLLLDAAKRIQDPEIVILIWGAGDEVDYLEKRLIDENINNVKFKGFVEKKYIPYITRQADLNLIHNNPSKMFRYGISFNKVFDYLAAGKPILATFPCRYNPAVLAGAGVSVDDPTPENIADAIMKFKNGDYCHRYDEFQKNALNAAKQYDYSALSQKLLKVIQSI